jgi:thiol-disulfide isomerase/thioredoxin
MKTLFLLLVISVLFTSCKNEARYPAFDYTPFSKASIELKVLGRPKDTLYAEARTSMNIPRDASFSQLLEISDTGTYYLRFQLDRPALSMISINDSSFNVVALPNDTVSITISFLNELLSVSFSGSEREINEYLAAKYRHLGYFDLRVPLNNMLSPGIEYADILSKTDSLVAVETDFLNNYLSAQDLPEWFVQFERAQGLYTGAGFKQFMPRYNEQFDLFKDTLPLDYYEFLTSVPVNNQDAILSERYFWFLDDYFKRDLLHAEYEALSGYSRVSKIVSFIHRNAEGALTGRVKDIYNEYQFALVCQFTSDSITVDSLAQEFNVRDLNRFRQAIASKSKGENPFQNLQAGDVVRDFAVVDKNDSLISLRDFKNKVVYINFWATWCGPCLKNIPTLNEMIDEYSTNADIVFLNICLYSQKENWVRIIRREDLRGINLFPEGRWGEILSAEFSVKSIPTYVLLGKENKLFENHTDKPPIVKARIEELLKLEKGMQ